MLTAKLVVLAAVLAVAGSTPNGCSPVPVDAGGKTPSCSTVVDRPTVVLHQGTPAILVHAVSDCIHEPLTFNVVLALGRLTDTGMVPVTDHAGRANNSCPLIPKPGHPVECSWFIQPCTVNGQYQALAKINGTGDDGTGTIEAFEDEEDSPIGLVRCR
jgi:hypothetical protein